VQAIIHKKFEEAWPFLKKQWPSFMEIGSLVGSIHCLAFTALLENKRPIDAIEYAQNFLIPLEIESLPMPQGKSISLQVNTRQESLIFLKK
jgi:hypothetical protein